MCAKYTQRFLFACGPSKKLAEWKSEILLHHVVQNVIRLQNLRKFYLQASILNQHITFHEKYHLQ